MGRQRQGTGVNGGTHVGMESPKDVLGRITAAANSNIASFVNSRHNHEIHEPWNSCHGCSHQHSQDAKNDHEQSTSVVLRFALQDSENTDDSNPRPITAVIPSRTQRKTGDREV